MTEEKQISYFYSDDEEEKILNFIFKKGKKNLLCVGLHPKEKEEQQTITANIESLCIHNGYDGFVIVFLNPTVTNDTYRIQKNIKEINANYLLIGALVMKDQFKIKNCMVFWGDEIESFNQLFFKQSAYKIIKDLSEDGLKFLQIDVSKYGNPASVKDFNNSFELKKFNHKTYLANIKKTVEIPPEISINGIEFK